MISNRGFTKLAQMAAARDIVDYVHEVDARKKKREQARSLQLPFMAASLLGIGAGLKGFGDAVLSPNDRKAVEDLIALQSRVGELKQPGPDANLRDKLLPEPYANPDIAGSPTLFYDYLDRASRAARVQLFGHYRPAESINKVKDLIGIAHTDPRKPNLTDGEREALNHYPAFEHGPVAAFIHQHRQAALNMRDGGDNASWYFHDTPYDGTKPMDFYNRLDGAFDDYLRDMGTDRESAASAPHGDQMEVVRGFQGWLDGKDTYKELGEQKRLAERRLAESQLWSAASYGRGAKAALIAGQDVPKALGYAAMAAGAGLGGYWLYRYLKDKYGRKTTLKRPEALAGLEGY
jgi:hypothetical protein